MQPLFEDRLSHVVDLKDRHISEGDGDIERILEPFCNTDCTEAVCFEFVTMCYNPLVGCRRRRKVSNVCPQGERGFDGSGRR